MEGKAAMDQRELYRADVYAWSGRQAALLRALAESGVALPNDLDLENIAEEIESVGQSERTAMESLWTQALAHLIKMFAMPGDTATRHWQNEADSFLVQASAHFRRSMLKDVDLDLAWRRAVRLSGRHLGSHGAAVPTLPAECPLDVAELLDERMDAARLLARLHEVLDA